MKKENKKYVYRTEITYRCTMQKRDGNGVVNGRTEVTEWSDRFLKMMVAL